MATYDSGGDDLLRILAEAYHRRSLGLGPSPYPYAPSQQTQGGGGSMGVGWGSGNATSPWDMLFAGLGSAHGAYVGNDPNSPMVPGGRQKGDSEWMIKAGGPIGGTVGSLFGFGGSGALAGQNVGATLADLKGGNIHNLGLDVSQNLPPLPGMQQPGWKGLMNGATGLPFGTLLGKLFG